MFDLIYNSAEYMDLFNEARINSGLTSGLYLQDVIDLYRNETDRKEYPNYNWLAEDINTAPTQIHNLSFSGGTKNTTYNFSLGYVDNKDTIEGYDFKKYNAGST